MICDPVKRASVVAITLKPLSSFTRNATIRRRALAHGPNDRREPKPGRRRDTEDRSRGRVAELRRYGVVGMIRVRMNALLMWPVVAMTVVLFHLLEISQGRRSTSRRQRTTGLLRSSSCRADRFGG